ncbi:MAG: hypothetical protein LBM25_04295 [Bacteroidales bacterium]|jgi:hypothetical protein|nr:hypothetical protein [Bacteroidales bacterium]
MKEKKIKNILFIFFVALLLVVTLQSYIPIVKLKTLRGEYQTATNPKFNSSSWFSGNYQSNFEKYTKDHLGFIPFFVRVHNQFLYSVLLQSPDHYIIYGKEAHIYDSYSIIANNYSFIGDSAINERIYRLSKVRDTLEKLNKKVVVLLAPNKVRTFSEYIPEQLKADLLGKKTNYEQTLKALKNNSIAHIDFNEWIFKLKQTSPYAIMPKNDAHWTRYAATLATDTIIKLISKLENISLPKLIIDSLIHSKKPLFGDDDAGKVLNVFWLKNDNNLVYPIIHIDSTKADKNRIPRPLVMGDSFFWAIYDIGFLNQILRKGEFWYYCKEVFSGNIKDKKPLKDPLHTRDLHNEINRYDIFILIQTEDNLDNLGFGFIDLAYNMFFVDGIGYSRTDDSYQQRLKHYKRSIISDKKWLNSVKKFAKEANISIEEAILKNAEYMVWSESATEPATGF